ncbi:MAG: hypothetical protein M3Y24_11380 [Acidobacteriota bacterium]|nr:hypothetical protein [Acidobacteriota bacterium]
MAFGSSGDGHNFVSLEYLIAQGRPLVSMPFDEVYLYQPTNIRESNANKSDDVDLNLRSVMQYKFATNYNILDNLTSGMYGNTVMTHDNVKKEWLRYKWMYPDHFPEFLHLMGYPFWSTAIADLSDPGAKFKLHGVGVNEYPVNPPDWLQPRISQLQQFHNVNITALIPGNTNRTVGELIGFKLPSPEPPIGNQQIYDNYFQGRY